VASFADRLAVPLEINGYGTLTVDTAYGGDSFVLVPASHFGLSLTPDEGRDIAELGAKITRAANDQIGFSHPSEDWNQISFCQFTGEVEKVDSIKTGRSAVVIDPGKIDRSPCGTGCSARMAVMAARGELGLNEAYVGTSIIGGRFDCRISALTRIGDRNAIVAHVKGRAWRTGEHKIWVEATEPWPQGYRITDTWPAMG